MNRGSLRRIVRLEPHATRANRIRAIVASAALCWCSVSDALAENVGKESASAGTPVPAVAVTSGSRGSAGDPSAGADPSRTILDTRLELELPLGCGSLGQFVERLRARSDRIRFADTHASRIVQARVSAEANGIYRATMTLQYPDGHSSSRIIEANNCAEAIDALALITAVTLDPLSITTDRKTQEPPADTRPSAPAPRPSAPSSGQPPPPPNVMPKGPPTDTAFAAGISFVTERGVSPGWMNGFEPSVRVMRNGSGAFSPSLRLGVSYMEQRGYVAPGGLADFGLASATLDLCPWRLRLGAVELRSCALFHAGLLVAEGRATNLPKSHTRPFWAAGASAEVVLLLSRTFGIPIRLQGAIPLFRDRFAFDPEAFHQVHRITFSGAVGMEIRFQ